MGFLVGSPYVGVYLDENGELKLIEVQEMGINPGPILRALGAGGRALSAGGAALKALPKLPAATRARLIARGVLPRTGPLRRPPSPPASPGTAVNELDALGRSTGASATITRETLRTGTKASSSAKVAGYGGRAAGHGKGHLIGRLLGGSGDDARNLTTLYQNPANTPVMSGFERQIARAVEGGQTVRYQVTPIYRGSELVPRAVTLSARGSRRLPARRDRAEQAQARPMSDLDDLRDLAPPPGDPPGAIDWDAAGIELPPDFVELAELYGAGTFDDGIAILVPGHASEAFDLARQTEVQRSALRSLRDQGFEPPHDPDAAAAVGHRRGRQRPVVADAGRSRELAGGRQRGARRRVAVVRRRRRRVPRGAALRPRAVRLHRRRRGRRRAFRRDA